MEENEREKKHAEKERDRPKRTFSIREIEIGDLAEVYELGELSFKADLWPMLYRSWDEYEVTTLFNTDGDYCLVAENDDEEDDTPEGERIVGFVLGTVISKSGSAWSYGYILWLCAHPNWQREGVAGKLVDKLVEKMVEEDGIRIMMADTDPDNVRAVKFFHKKGFVNEKPHLYLSTNLETNERYGHLLKASRAAALEEEYLKKIRKLASGVAPPKPKKSGKKNRRVKKKTKNKTTKKKD